MQNNIEKILKKHTIIPVATIENSSQIDEYYALLKTNNIYQDNIYFIIMRINNCNYSLFWI